MSLKQLAARLRAASLSVAVAESAAGGLISAELSRLPGSSAYFKGGVVAYDDASKQRLLGISERLLREHGAVSAEACRAMAQAARRVFGADFGLGETAIAGPDGATDTKPVGLSYLAVAGDRGVEVRESRLNGTREQNRRAAARIAIELLEQATSRLSG